MLIDLSPIRQNREYRLLFLSQLVSLFGSMITYVAIPYQVYQLSKSPFFVGLLGAVQAVPLVAFGLAGGTFADRLDRRRLILSCECLMLAATLALALNAALPSPSLGAIFLLAAFLQAVTGFHRPSLEALTQKVVASEHYASVGALSSVQRTGGAIIGPMLGGVLLASGGATAAYLLDAATFAWALGLIALLRRSDFRPQGAELSPAESFREGIRFAWGRPELLGSYFVDIVAMTFAFPVALFPALAQQWGGERAAGLLFSAMSVGSLAMALLSGRFRRYRRYGANITVAAAVWGVFIVGFGESRGLWLALFFLAMAGAADMVSGVYRTVLWNQVIPNEMRGRLAGVEMISYMIGPLLGNLRVGAQAAITGNRVAIVSGGLLCALACVACAWIFPRFWGYRAPEAAREPV